MVIIFQAYGLKFKYALKNSLDIFLSLSHPLPPPSPPIETYYKWYKRDGECYTNFLKIINFIMNDNEWIYDTSHFRTSLKTLEKPRPRSHYLIWTISKIWNLFKTLKKLCDLCYIKLFFCIIFKNSNPNIFISIF